MERYYLKNDIKMAYLHYWQNKNTQKTGVTTSQFLIFWVFYCFTFPYYNVNVNSLTVNKTKVIVNKYSNASGNMPEIILNYFSSKSY